MDPNNNPKKRYSFPDPTPAEIPLHLSRPPTPFQLAQAKYRADMRQITEMVSQAAGQVQAETFEEADDFEVGEDYDPRSDYELDDDQLRYTAPPPPPKEGPTEAGPSEDGPPKPKPGEESSPKSEA